MRPQERAEGGAGAEFRPRPDRSSDGRDQALVQFIPEHTRGAGGPAEVAGKRTEALGMEGEHAICDTFAHNIRDTRLFTRLLILIAAG